LAELVRPRKRIGGTDCGLCSRVHRQITWAKLRSLRDGAAFASKKLWT
jgi:methionine synthase II (cobalamin-independent)